MPEETVTLRPTANGSSNAWASKSTKERWEEVAQTAVEPAEPLTTHGVVSAATAGLRQGFQFTWPTLSAGQKIVGAVVHFNGNWATKLKVNAADQTSAELVEGELEAAAGGEANHWANSAKNNWTKLKGSGSTFPWSPWTKEELEKVPGTGGHFQVTFITGKATAQEAFEVYVVVTILNESTGELQEAVMML